MTDESRKSTMTKNIILYIYIKVTEGTGLIQAGVVEIIRYEQLDHGLLVRHLGCNTLPILCSDLLVLSCGRGKWEWEVK